MMLITLSHHGWLVIDKPLHVTSAQVVHLVKKKFSHKGLKIGHGGTLDPLATGILPLALGEATKTVSYVMQERKCYRFEVTWGEARSTDDQEGDILYTSSHIPTHEAILSLLPTFQGKIYQAPPLYSALKIRGKRACDLMRQQQPVELAPRLVEIFSLTLLKIVSPLKALFEVECGKGTYVRSLARDMGNRLTCYGYASSIDRISVGLFEKKHSLSLERLASLPENVLLKDYKKEILEVLDDIPAVLVNETQVRQLKQGQRISFEEQDLIENQKPFYLCVDSHHTPIAMVRFCENKLWPLRIFNI